MISEENIPNKKPSTKLRIAVDGEKVVIGFGQFPFKARNEVVVGEPREEVIGPSEGQSLGHSAFL